MKKLTLPNVCCGKIQLKVTVNYGKLYDSPYGGKAVGRHKDGKVYDKPYGGSAIGRTENKDGAGYWLLKDKEDDQKK